MAKLACHDNVIKWKHFPRNWPFVRAPPIYRGVFDTVMWFHWRAYSRPRRFFLLDFTSFVIKRNKNSYRCWTTVIIITVLLSDTVQQTSRGDSAAVDSSREVCWTVSRNYTVCFYPVMSKLQNSINIYLWFWHYKGPSQYFRKSKCTECDVIAMQHCDVTAVVLDAKVCSLRQVAMLTAELTLPNTWFNCGKRVKPKILEAGSRASYGPYHGLVLPNHGIMRASLTDWLLIPGSYSQVYSKLKS